MGAGLDAAKGAAAGAAAGTVVGGVVGAVVGGLTGKRPAASIDPARDDGCWRDNFVNRPYVTQGSNYESHGPAYAFGVDAASRYPGRSFEDIEPEMSRTWTTGGRASLLGWSCAKHAARDAWDRVSGHGNPSG